MDACIAVSSCSWHESARLQMPLPSFRPDSSAHGNAPFISSPLSGISVGSIFGVYEPSPECRIEDMDDPEAMMQK